MADLIIVDGDQVMFMPAFGSAIVVVKPGKISGTGSTGLVKNKAVCLVGDESKVEVPGCPYINAAFVGGVGTLKIKSLAPNQKSLTTKVQGKPVILKGANFIAIFEVTSPAKMPSPNGPVNDPISKYPGMGQFIPSNLTITAS
jgi:hypothetical protein